MPSSLTVLCFCIFSTNLVNSFLLPSYIQPCAVNDPNLSECLLKTAKKILKEFSKEDSVLGLKSLDPLYVGRVQISKKGDGNGIRIVIDNSYVEGLSDADIQNITIFLKEKTIYTRFKATVVLTGDYVVDGKILLLPINGAGDMVLKIRDTVCDYFFKYLLNDDESGTTYSKIDEDNLKCTFGRTTFKLNNLFKGNKDFSDNMNRILNENWQEIVEEINSPVLEAVRKGVKNRVNSFYSKIPYENLLPMIV